MSTRRLAVLATLALVATAGCLGFFGGGGDDPVVVGEADGAVFVQSDDGDPLPAGTAIEVTVTGENGQQQSQIVTLGEAVDGGTRVFLDGGDDLAASVGQSPQVGETACDVSVSVDTGDETVTGSVGGADCLGVLGGAEDADPSVEIGTEAAADYDGDAQYVFVRPTDETTLSPETRLNVTLAITINDQTQEDTLETTLDQSVAPGTTIYLADDGGDLAVLVGGVDDSATVVRPNELPAPLEMTVTVETASGTTTETLTFASDEEQDG